ncbi:MAG: hypothetical protein RIC55_30085 [Pirellulaceae bacterium]
MSSNDNPPAEESIHIDLRKPGLAALLAWLWPGAGHLYQRRYAKGVLFMVCILGTYFFGLGISGGRAVYASFQSEDFRWQYVCQLGVGAPALPAIIQNRLVMNEEEPLIGEGMMAPPEQPVLEQHADMLARWHEEMPTTFEMGTLYTMIAGLLNVLAIYDAYAGPVVASEEDEDEEKPPPDDSKPPAET